MCLNHYQLLEIIIGLWWKYETYYMPYSLKLLVVLAWACLLPSCMSSDLNVAYQVRPVFNGKSLYAHKLSKTLFHPQNPCMSDIPLRYRTYLHAGHTLWYRTDLTVWDIPLHYRKYLNGMRQTSTVQDNVPLRYGAYLYGTGQVLYGTVHTSTVQDRFLQYRTYLYGTGHTSRYGTYHYITGNTSMVWDKPPRYRTTYLYGMVHTSMVQDKSSVVRCRPLQYRTDFYSTGHTSMVRNIPLQYRKNLHSTGKTSTVQDKPSTVRDYPYNTGQQISTVQDTPLQYRTYLYRTGHASTVWEEPLRYG